MSESITKPRRVQPTGLETVSACAARFGLARTSVVRAINSGRLPAYTADTHEGYDLLLVKPSDADAIWAARRKPLAIDKELVFA